MHRILSWSLIALLTTAATLPAAEPADAFFFKKGDRVVFLGDSITEQYQYSNYIELYLTTRFPGWGMTFLNAGIGGDTATGGAGRFASHVLAEKPTCVTIDFGMNDGGYRDFDAKKAAGYAKNTEAMLQAAKTAGVRVALLSPNAVEVDVRPGLKTYLQTQEKFYAPLKDLAAKYQLPYVDQYAITKAALERITQDMAKVRPFPDGVHTNGAGGLLMAHTILVGLHAPAVVSDVEIDVAGKASRPTQCSVDELTVSDDRITFKRTDHALPLPVQSDWRGLLPYVNDLKDLNYYGLKIKGLKGKYALAIDGKEIGTFSAEDLAGGVNLGNLDKGPLFDQGNLVLKALSAKNDVVHQRFRGVVMYDVRNVPSWLVDNPLERKAAELQKRKDRIDEMQAEVYKKAQPVPHTFELKAAK